MLDTFVLLDLETTGLSPKEDKIIEVGAIKYVHGEETEKFETFVNPARRISDRIIGVTGITDDMVADAPYIEDVIGELVEFLRGNVIIGHNIVFDYSFVKQNAVNNKLDFNEKVLDTLKLARKFLPELPKRSLDYLCEHFGIVDENHHRAVNDARVAGELYKLLCEKYEADNGEAFMPYEPVCKVKKETPVTKKQADWLKALVTYHNIEIDYDIDKLTKNCASRHIDKILAQYGRCPR